ncbi:hypothetical protein GSI_09585 [Ganoderma sinense ZZ0214-1]|uniref:Lectin n=1 Tax=Ganoderma sinense ZZ0214-1 TaxID=1077348 RepID=A0A2G8S3E4_9APHY|nr:hypothetical protein GSI_09585 [Ganoderma sinense ZZ0214-1]
MAYVITARLFQCNPTLCATLVEQTCQVNASWAECKGAYVLSMTGSGTSGTLRFNLANGEYILVGLGVHNYKRWCDVKTAVDPSNSTGMTIHPKYYQEGTDENAMIWKQLAQYSVKSAKGTTCSVSYSVADGNNLVADIVIQ